MVKKAKKRTLSMLSRLLEKIKFCHLKQTFKDYPYLTVNVHLVKTSTSEEEFKTF